MHHQLQQEIRMAIQRACTQDPVKIPGDLQRLRSLDLQGEIPAYEYQRLECIAAARMGRFAEAEAGLTGLPAGGEQVLQMLERCPEHGRGDFRSFVTRARRVLAANAAKAAKKSGNTPPRASEAPSGTSGSIATTLVVFGLIGLMSVVAWLVWSKFLQDPDPEGLPLAEAEIPVEVRAINEFPDDEIGTVERHVVRAVLEIRILTENDGFRWMPVGTGTAFPVGEGLYLTNRHVVRLKESDRASMVSSLEEFLETSISVLDERVILVGSFGYGVLREVPAEIRFLGVDRNDDVALLQIDEPLGHQSRFAKVPSRRSRVFAVGFPGVSEDLARFLEGTDTSIDRYQRLLGAQKDSDGSLDLVRYFGPLNLEPTTNDGIVSKEEISDGVLQTNAVIAHGSSGGPLLDEQGRVIGMNTWGSGALTSEGFGASIRSDRIKQILSASSFHDNIDWGDVTNED